MQSGFLACGTRGSSFSALPGAACTSLRSREEELLSEASRSRGEAAELLGEASRAALTGAKDWSATRIFVTLSTRWTCSMYLANGLDSDKRSPPSWLPSLRRPLACNALPLL